MFFVRMWFLYGLCLRFCIVLFFVFMSPRLPSSGNRRLCFCCFYWNLFVWFFRCFYCCFSFLPLVVFEGGGFIDLPGIKMYSRL
uniref:Ribosomal protein S12 n=1 Tax=Vickermania ingenoplastis TaxID=2720891 RepID=A0A873A185_9TRYP|nr:ribosomal protein S12 [Vickermania ingenoplastis]